MEVVLPESLKKELDMYSKEGNFQLLDDISYYVDELKSYCVANKRLADVNNKKSPTITLEEAKRALERKKFELASKN